MLDSLLQEVMTGDLMSNLYNTTKPQFLDSHLQEVTAGVCYVRRLKVVF